MFNKIKDKFRQLKKTKNSKFSYFSMAEGHFCVAFSGLLWYHIRELINSLRRCRNVPGCQD
jgi:hypothetical protein